MKRQMTPMMTTVMTILLITSAGIRAQSQVPATGVTGTSIEALVAMALERAPLIDAARARVQVAEGERRQASLRPNPSASLDRREQFGGSEDETSLGVTWPLDLFRRDARVAVADHHVHRAELAVDDAVVVRAALVRLRASRVLAAIRQRDVTAKVAQAAKLRRDLLAERASAGAGRPLDRDLAEVEWRRAEADLTKWTGEAESALAELKATVGLPASAELRLARSLDEEAAVLLPAPAARPEDAIDSRPDVMALQWEETRAGASRDLAQREGRWDASVFGAYMRRGAGLSPSRPGMNEVTLGVIVDLPWRDRRQGAVAAAEAEGRAARAELAERRLDAGSEIAAARARDAAAVETVRQYRDGLVDLAERNLGVVRESWALGQGTLFDVIEEERRYLALQADYSSALRELIDARASLRRAMGVR